MSWSLSHLCRQSRPYHPHHPHHPGPYRRVWCLGAAITGVVLLKPFSIHTPEPNHQQQTTPAIPDSRGEQPAIPAIPTPAVPVVVPRSIKRGSSVPVDPSSTDKPPARNLERPSQGRAGLNAQTGVGGSRAKNPPANEPPGAAAVSRAPESANGPELAHQTLPIVEPPADHSHATVLEGSASHATSGGSTETHAATPVNPPLTYHGPSSGTLTWQGQVDGTALLSIENGQPSFGTIAGTPLPGVLCMLQISDAKHFSVAVAPAPSNQWKKVILNVHGKGVMNVKLTWVIP